MNLDRRLGMAAIRTGDYQGFVSVEFVEYVMSFYGAGGLYDMGVTREDVLLATGIRIEVCRMLNIPFEADSLDREAVRDILIDRFGYVWAVGD
jgi:hypothetical protein